MLSSPCILNALGLVPPRDVVSIAMRALILGIPFVPAAIGLPGEPGPGAAVGRCRFKRIESRGGSACFRRLKLNYDELLSSVAFNLNLRRYAVGCNVLTSFSQVGGGLALVHSRSETSETHHSTLFTQDIPCRH